jgi:hypothetical protein
MYMFFYPGKEIEDIQDDKDNSTDDGFENISREMSPKTVCSNHNEPVEPESSTHEHVKNNVKNDVKNDDVEDTHEEGDIYVMTIDDIPVSYEFEYETGIFNLYNKAKTLCEICTRNGCFSSYISKNNENACEVYNLKIVRRLDFILFKVDVNLHTFKLYKVCKTVKKDGNI